MSKEEKSGLSTRESLMEIVNLTGFLETEEMKQIRNQLSEKGQPEEQFREKLIEYHSLADQEIDKMEDKEAQPKALIGLSVTLFPNNISGMLDR